MTSAPVSRTAVHRLNMAHPGDLSALADAIDAGRIDPRRIAAVIGKTEGNGGVNDFTRGYFTQSLFALLAARMGVSADDLAARIPCVLSGGTEGVLSPHYVVFVREDAAAPAAGPRLALGVAFTGRTPYEDIGRTAHAHAVAGCVRAAIRDAGIDDPRDVAFVQVKSPVLTAPRVQDALARGKTVATTDANRSMALARAAAAFGVALALGEIDASRVRDDAFLSDFSVRSDRASISSGVEITANEVVVLGNSRRCGGDLAIACRPMIDALDIGGVHAALGDLGIPAAPQVSAVDRDRIAAVLVKCEPDRRGAIRGNRHTMLDDTDINAQRHIRGAVGGLVAGVIGDGRIFVSGGAEHQGPDGGGLVAIIARAAV
jgi:cyanuric acid amidohydrolase